ncbi:MAG: glycine cleavage system aminomethyltransferase GcvT [Armatimonadetes bacterium]|nr:glycine cleavage system aminomethyltransferase GcvT [Armatimonadota bacterium]
MPSTGLYARHLAAGAKMTEFAGWQMPVSYTRILEEAGFARRAAGLFDLSHMGEIEVSGPQARTCLQRVLTHDLDRLPVGGGQYTLLCREDGGILDDLICYRLEAERYLLVVNAVNIDKDWLWLRQHCPEARAENATLSTGLIALQGPQAAVVLQGHCAVDLASLPYLGIVTGEVAGAPVAVARSGYTGEDGFELFGDWDMAPVWDTLLAAARSAGGGPCGLGARDILRIEAGYCLWGSEITEEIDPYAAGLGWAVRPEKGDFIGRAALERLRSAGAACKRAGFLWDGRAPVRGGSALRTEWGEGVVTSGTYSPILERAIGMGYVPARREGGRLAAATGAIASADGKRTGRICPLPFIRGSVRSGRPRL